MLPATGRHVQTFSELCEAVLSVDEWETVSKQHGRRSIDKFGNTSPSVEAMGAKCEPNQKQSRRQRDLGRIVALCIKQVLDLAKAGQPDPAGVLKLALAQTEMAGVRPSAAGDISRVPDNSLCRTIANAWRVARRIKDKSTAMQMLSLLVVQPWLSDAQVGYPYQ